MNLSKFITELCLQGNATLSPVITPFAKDDLNMAVTVLHELHVQDSAEMPLTPPAFSPEAALWAATFVCRASQFLLLRDQTEDTIIKTLTPYPGSFLPEAIYSVDITLRCLPDLMNIAKALAPGDVLVKILKQTALLWPFSSVGIPLEQEPDSSALLAHPSLRIAYTDRIISRRDTKRLSNPAVAESVRAALGSYADSLWPDFSLLQNTVSHDNR